MPEVVRTLIRSIYRYLPYKTQVFDFVKAVGLRPSPKIYRHLYFSGAFSVQIGSRNSFKMLHYGNALENELYWGGIEGFREFVSLLIWIEMSKTAQCVFDVGANTGVYSLVTKSVNPDAMVYAFEPILRIHKKLKRNSLLNNCDINCVQKAVSNKDGKETIYDVSTDHAYSASLNSEFLPDEDLIAVQIDTIKLDSFIVENQITQLNLIKIDVESYEPEVIEGFQSFINEYSPAILVEVLSRESAEKLKILLADTRYQYFNIDDLNRKIRRTGEIEVSDDFNYLLCLEDQVKDLINSPALSQFFI